MKRATTRTNKKQVEMRTTRSDTDKQGMEEKGEIVNYN
jgi:hypothetical protein